MADQNSKTLVIERVFDAPVEKVWRAWTETEMIKKWWGPKGFTAPEIKLDLRVGGKYLFCMRGPAGTEWDKDMWTTGEYKEVVPMKKIVSTDNFADKDGNVVSAKAYGMNHDFPELLLTITFEEQDGKTKLTLRHEGFPAGDEVGAEQGWNQSLDKLAKVVEAK
jgi:uncharacterized protein YndB with AHSA1/START domain